MAGWRGKSLWSVSSRFAAAGLAFLLNVILARVLSQNDLGLFYLNLSLAWGGALLCQWGTSILAVKWVASARARADHDSVRTSTWSLIAYTLLHGTAVSIFMVIAMQLGIIGHEWKGLLLLAGWMFSIGLQNLLPEIIRGFDDLKWASLLSGPIPQAASVLCLGIGALTEHGDVAYYEAAALMIVGSLLASVIGIVLVIRRAKPTRRITSYMPFLRETTPIAVSLWATYLLSQADLWVCSAVLGKSDVAVYGIAQRFVAFVSMPMMIFGSVATPAMAEALAKNQPEKLRALASKGTFITSCFAILVFLGGVLIGWPVMTFLFGEKYANSYPLFLILGAGQVFHAVAGPNGYLLLLSGRQAEAMISTVVSAFILFGGAWLGGRYLGSSGIAMANSIALTVQTIWMWYSVRKHLQFDPSFRFSWNGVKAWR